MHRNRLSKSYCSEYFRAAIISWLAIFPDVVRADDGDVPWLRTNQELILFSANDGQAHLRLDSRRQFDLKHQTEDSLTLISLSPNRPPQAKTIYQSAPNSVVGPPYMAITPDGRFGFVISNGQGLFKPEKKDLLSVVDLKAVDLKVIQSFKIPSPWMAAMHPDGKHLVVSCGTGFQVYEVSDRGIELIEDGAIGYAIQSFDISPKGDLIVATEAELHGDEFSRVSTYTYSNGKISRGSEVKTDPNFPAFDSPWAPRFTPNGQQVLISNGGGIGSKGKLDAVLLLDVSTNQPKISDALLQVGDGIESLAIHPSGTMAVIACLEELPPFAHNVYSHLAVIDLTSKPMRVLYYLDVEAVPEGIAFTPDGTQLFVQFTSANRIASYSVNGFKLARSPFVIRTGNGPASMAIGVK